MKTRTILEKMTLTVHEFLYLYSCANEDVRIKATNVKTAESEIVFEGKVKDIDNETETKLQRYKVLAIQPHANFNRPKTSLFIWSYYNEK